MANWTAIDEVLDYIERHPEEWDQKHYTNAFAVADGSACNTTYCVAGTAVVLSGGCYVMEKDHGYWLSAVGDKVEVDVEGARVLGLTGAQADAIFEGGESLAITDPIEMRHYIKRVVETIDAE